MPTPDALPKYITIAEGLARDIRAGRYAVGERLPGERDMAQTYDVSVGTLRKSLAELETRGMLHRIQGSGNYVSETTDHDAIYAFFRLERPDGGGLPTAQVLDVRFDDHWIIRRVRALDGVPMALEEIYTYLPRDAHLDQFDLSDALYHTYRQHLALFITSAQDRVTVGQWPNWGPTLGSGACGLVARRAFAHDGALAETSTTWYAPDRAVYTNRFT